jgi:hypothetical protein
MGRQAAAMQASSAIFRAQGVQVAVSPNYVWHYSLGLVFGQKSRSGSIRSLAHDKK